jgi:hypothetical protein
MQTCLCCSRNLPFSENKTCPLCGHGLMGMGWRGIDYHWQMRHEAELTFRAFWDGLCAAHRSEQPETAGPAGPVAIVHSIVNPPGSIAQAFDKALDRRSSRVENRLTRALIAAVAEELWRRDHWLDLQVFKDQAADSGYDLVLGSNGVLRHIQVRHMPVAGRGDRFPLRPDPARRAGGCAVVLVHRDDPMVIDHCLFLGGAEGEPLPDFADCPLARPAAGGEGGLRERREVPRQRFSPPLTMAETVAHLFPGIPEREAALLAQPGVPAN